MTIAVDLGRKATKQTNKKPNNSEGPEYEKISVRGSKLFCQRGPTLTFFCLFLVYEGREDQNTTISGPY